jgi:hypothetical protein
MLKECDVVDDEDRLNENEGEGGEVWVEMGVAVNVGRRGLQF